MRKLTILLLLVFVHAINAQDKLVDHTIDRISFEKDSIRSVYDWITNNIRYDVRKLTAINNGSINKKRGNYRTEEEFLDDQLKKVIELKRGVCQDYSLLFDAIMKKIGYDSYIIEGMTKNQNGNLNRRLGHTWNAVKVNGEWKLYDPTWGAGYINDNKKFVKKYFSNWFDVPNTEMIKTHMPYDPIWQLSLNPIDYDAFVEGEYQDAFIKDYKYAKLIDEFLLTNKKEQMIAQVERSEAMESDISIIINWRKRIKTNIGQFGIQNNRAAIDSATENSNEAVVLFNDYIKAKNKRFKGSKYSIENAKALLEQSKLKAESSLAIYKDIDDVEDKRAVNFIKNAIKSSETLLRRVESEFRFIERLN